MIHVVVVVDAVAYDVGLLSDFRASKQSKFAKMDGNVILKANSTLQPNGR